MKNKIFSISKLTALLLSIYLSVFFAVIIPFHCHADYNLHNDCSVCLAACQLYIFKNNSFIQILFVFSLILIVSKIIYTNNLKENLHLRSPPSF